MAGKIDLSKHIHKLQSIQASASAQTKKADDAILFWGCAADKSYLPYLKSCVGGATTFIRTEEVTVLTSVKLYCKQKGITRIISSSVSLLKLCLNWDKKKQPSLANYAGSYFTIPTHDGDSEIEIVFINPIKQLLTVPYMRMHTKRLITKLTKPNSWYQATEFNWDIITASNEASYYEELQKSFLIAVDIETFKENAVIRCLSYTGFIYDSSARGGIRSVSVVLPIDSEYAVSVMRKWNWKLQAPKVLQNGKYDMAYLTRYNAPVYNWLYDTATMFHCWYVELPKDLGFLNSFLIREAMYWKDLSETNDLHEYYRYNALDTWGTGNAWLAMILEIPSYAFNNYLIEFPVNFPAHMCEMTGITRDMDKLAEAKKEQDVIISEETASLSRMLSLPAGTEFNVNSPPQMKALLKMLGCSDLKSADEKNLKKAAFRHPFNSLLINKVLKIRKARKLASTYLTPGKEFSRLDGTGNQILFALNPHGTDTGRLASKEHHFWCGLQIQNIPRGPAVKKTLCVPDDWVFCEVDLSQAESRDTGYISGDPTLIQNVEHSPDFHKSNASMFFGIPFEEITKELRQLGKPVNHGANYNMGAYVLVDTMGEEKTIEAKGLLGLNKFWSSVQVADYLLTQFHRVYPRIRGVFYKGVIDEIMTTRMLSSTAVHHHWTPLSSSEIYNQQYPVKDEHYKFLYNRDGAWTRFCFGDPTKSKTTLNSYIAHPPQSLNAMTLNKAFLHVFHDISINPDYSDNFKMIAQVHDSILFRYRKGHDYLPKMVQERMQIPVTLKGYDGKIRTFVVPAETENGEGKAKYWSEK